MKRIFVSLAALSLLVVPFFAAHAKEAKKDAQYLQRLAEVDLAEVQMGKLAQEKASSEEVKDFAEHMVDDHGKALDESRDLAKQQGVDLPSSPSKKHQAEMKKLQSKSGAAFDRAYMQAMVKGHREALKMAQRAAKNADASEIKDAARKHAEKISEHLDKAKTTLASLGGGKSAATGASGKKK